MIFSNMHEKFKDQTCLLIVHLFFAYFSPFEYAYTMKRRVEDQELIFAPQQQHSRRPPVQGIADNFQQRALAPAPTVIEAAADNMQPSTGIQYSLPQGYQVWMVSMIFNWTAASKADAAVLFAGISAPN